MLLLGVSVAASVAVSPTESVSSLGETETSVAHSSTLNVLVATALPVLMLLAVIFTWPGATGLQFARGLADGGDVFVAGIPLDFCVGHLERVAVQGVDGGRRGAPLLSVILDAASAEAGSCMQNASVSTSAIRCRRCFFKTIPSLISESRVI